MLYEVITPTHAERHAIIRRSVAEYISDHPGHRVEVDTHAQELLAANLAGLSFRETERLARNAIYVDGALTRDDLPAVMEAKYKLLNRDSLLQYEYDTARWSDIGGFARLKSS